MIKKINRRIFFQGGLSLSGLLLTQCKSLYNSEISGTDPSKNSAVPGIKTPLRVRRSLTIRSQGTVAINPAVENDLRLYGLAVKLMKETDVWKSQALIHQNYCPHGNWYFLPWHRWYLYYFEEQCRKVLERANIQGHENFALPYWNWFECPSIPKPFFVSNSPLKEDRDVTENGMLSRNIASDLVARRIMEIKDFDAFASGRAAGIRDNASQGMLEAMPHNGVHVFVGGHMGSFMSPLDPIFWMHHCHVDKIWAEWASKNPTESTPQDPSPENGYDPRFTAEFWKAQELGTFVDREGNDVKGTVDASLDFKKLGYTYDTLATAGNDTKGSNSELAQSESENTSFGLKDTRAPRKRVKFETNKLAIKPVGSNLWIEIPGAKIQESRVDQILANFSKKLSAKSPVLFTLNVKNIPIPLDRNVRLIGHLFIGSAKALEEKNLIGSVSFFGIDHHHKATTIDALFDVTEVMKGLINEKKQIANGAINGPLILVVSAAGRDNKPFPYIKQLPTDVIKSSKLEIILKVNVDSPQK